MSESIYFGITSVRSYTARRTVQQRNNPQLHRETL